MNRRDSDAQSQGHHRQTDVGAVDVRGPLSLLNFFCHSERRKIAGFRQFRDVEGPCA